MLASPWIALLLACLAQPAPDPLEIRLLGGPVRRPLLDGEAPELLKGPGGEPRYLVRGRQVGLRIDEPAFATPGTTLSWSWCKEKGVVVVIQVALVSPETGQTRYLGYGAGAWSEPPSPDSTVEVFLSREPPRAEERVERDLEADVRLALGWTGARIAGVYLSPWDGEPGVYSDVVIAGASPADPAARRRAEDLEASLRAGTGDYRPLRLKDSGERRAERFEWSFEECAPGRSSGSNEWSAFGIDGDRDSNAMGRGLRVRYPLFDLVFRLEDGGREIEPGGLESFRLGLVRGRLPAIAASWEHEGVSYRVSAMTVPGGALGAGNFDLYKLEARAGEKPSASRLAAALDGPPDLYLEDEGTAAPGAAGGGAAVVRGQGAAPLLVADRPASSELVLRDWGCCDRRAKAYATGAPAKVEAAIGTYRLGLEGLPVTYRLRAEPGKRHVVCLASRGTSSSGPGGPAIGSSSTAPRAAGPWRSTPSRASGGNPRRSSRSSRAPATRTETASSRSRWASRPRRASATRA